MRRWRASQATARTGLLATLLAILALWGCGDDSEAGEEADTQAGCDTEVGALVVEPVDATPGDTVLLSVENTTERATLAFGLAGRLERASASGEWAPADDAMVSRPVPDLAVIVSPGDVSVAGAGATSDSIELTGDAQPGQYRVVKDVTVAKGGPRGAQTLCAALRVG